MVLVRELRQILAGVPANFDTPWTSIEVDFNRKQVGFTAETPPDDDDLKPWDGESERFFPNIVGMNDDDGDYRTNTTPRIDLSNPDKQSKDRFIPNDAGWTDENEYYYQKFKEGGNNLTYLQELDKLKKNGKHEHLGARDFGSNTVTP